MTFLREDLQVRVDPDAVQRRERVELAAHDVEGTGGDFAQVVRVFAELRVLAFTGVFRHCVAGRLEDRGIHAGFLSDFFNRLTDKDVALLFVIGEQLIELRGVLVAKNEVATGIEIAFAVLNELSIYTQICLNI